MVGKYLNTRASLTPAAFAQVTTSGVQGTVSKADGAPAVDATVTIEDTRNGLTRTVFIRPALDPRAAEWLMVVRATAAD